ncbi:MAG: DNA-directed RNA polymerase subunit omega [Gammaproteobacteria bacterium]|jgi:DNA-directed RNA polymerase subunit omega|nr:DNA-directed RNA polymerase subunit omega [Woeseiaceae bacterium]RCL43186.1 MAG: DNA-directed RNA polymerase subunit omega [Gammaproteobacteria bacterium]|tara:strand:- start:59 stop:340 length:282 start_codon:yes stop_codon:yes gene_type:complete
MARITVEDCMSKVDNIFDMILLAAKRAKRIANGADALVERENDKPTVIALREIADGKMSESILEELDEIASDELLQDDESDEIMPLQSLSIGR